MSNADLYVWNGSATPSYTATLSGYNDSGACAVESGWSFYHCNATDSSSGGGGGLRFRRTRRGLVDGAVTWRAMRNTVVEDYCGQKKDLVRVVEVSGCVDAHSVATQHQEDATSVLTGIAQFRRICLIYLVTHTHTMRIELSVTIIIILVLCIMGTLVRVLMIGYIL